MNKNNFNQALQVETEAGTLSEGDCIHLLINRFYLHVFSEKRFKWSCG